MNCALWLNKQKVRHASEIPKNLDVASLRGYFLAGSLLEWLRENGGEEYAEKLSRISADDAQLNGKIADIFGGKPLRAKQMQTADEELCAPPVRKSEKAEKAEKAAPCGSAVSSYSLPSSGSFAIANYGSGSSAYLRFSSFGELRELLLQAYGSFAARRGSFAFGSLSGFHEWEWEWLFRLFYGSGGSFAFGSFSSFHEWEWEWLFRFFSSSGGSFPASGFGSFFTLFPNGSFGSFDPFAKPVCLPVLDEYDRIMLETLMKCPLDRFGYGVHNI